jgi:hypothetical protein
MKFWKIGSREDTLGFYACADTSEQAVSLVEALIGPQNPARRVVRQLPECPKGYRLSGLEPCLLEESDDDET